MGSSDFAAKILTSLAAKFTISGVFTQPDREAGRGKQVTPPPVKIVSNALSIPVYQPQKLRAPESFEELQSLEPDLIVVAAYGQILRQNVLDLPKYGCINVHASYLPRWRGAAPIQAAILAGDEFTGVSIMKMDAGIDTGPVLSMVKVTIDKDETARTLEKKLSEAGSDLLLETLPQYLDGRLEPKTQSETGSTYARMLKKQDGELDFSKPAAELERQIRAYDDWPGSFIFVGDQVLKVRKAEVIKTCEIAAGIHGVCKGSPAIGTCSGTLLLQEVQPSGKKWMSGSNYLRGNQKTWLTETHDQD
jgi:methionyl-tRNA formyltransferase